MDLKLIPNIWLQSLRCHLSVRRGQWLPFLTVPPTQGHTHIHAKPRKSSLIVEKKSSFLVVLVRQRGSQQGHGESILGHTVQFFPRHLPQTPVSLKRILCFLHITKNSKYVRSCLYLEAVWLQNRWRVPAWETLWKVRIFSQLTWKNKAPGLGSGLPIPISPVSHRTLFTQPVQESLLLGKCFNTHFTDVETDSRM